MIFVNKDENGGHFNRTYGMDANFNFFNYLDVSSYVLGTETPGIQDKDMAGFFRMAWRRPLLDNRLVADLAASHISIEENFNAEAGFVPRGGYDVEEQTGEGMRKTNVEIEFQPRPGESIPWVRDFRPKVEIDYITDQENVLQTREVQSRFRVFFNNSSSLSVSRRST